jgi:phenylacetate-CoA ligase
MTTDNEHYDDLETREPEVRERALFAALPGQIAHAKANAPYFARLLKEVEPNEVRDRKALAQLPVTRKSDLIALQKDAPPFAGMTAVAPGALGRVFSSPGPIYDPQGTRADFWRMGRALFAAGFRRGDLVHNTFSYHFTPAGMMMDLGAQAVGCAVFPAGIGQTELQVAAIADLKPDGYARNAFVPEDPPREGRRTESRCLEPEESAGVGRGLAAAGARVAQGA